MRVTTREPAKLLSSATASQAVTSAGMELWVYGSVARGTHSRSSDLDVLIVSDTEPDPSLVRAAVADLPQGEHLSVRRYSWHEARQMADYGSLFFLHLKLEGRPLYSTSPGSGMMEMLATLPNYRNELRDIRGFVQSLEDVRGALDEVLDDEDVVFELGVIATVIRHCSILACYKLGVPTFQMEDSIRYSFAAVGMAPLGDQAVQLYQFRLATARHMPVPARPSLSRANSWLSYGQEFVEKVGTL